MTLPRDVSSPREVADRLDTGVQVVAFDIPELVIPNSGNDYPEVEGYRMEIPAGALIMDMLLSGRVVEPMPEGKSAYVEYRLYDDASWEIGLAELGEGWYYKRADVAIQDSFDAGQLVAGDMSTSFDYGRELMRGILVTNATAEGVLTDVAIRVLYVA